MAPKLSASKRTFEELFCSEFEPVKAAFLSQPLDALILLDSSYDRITRILGAVIKLKQQEAELEQVLKSAQAEVDRFLEE